MKLTSYLAGVLAVASLGCGSGTDSGNLKTDVNPATFDSLINALSDEQLLDVRTLEEYQGGHLENSLNYDWNDATFHENIKNLDKSKPVLVYCRSGNRSGQAADHLREQGFTVVYELEGGIAAWEADGRPVTQAEGQLAANGEVTLEMYNKTIADNPVVLVDFTATWCGPCKMLAPSLHELEKEMSTQFVLLTVDVDRDRPVAEHMNIMAMPTLVLYKNGAIQWRNEGLVPKDLVADKIKSVQ